MENASDRHVTKDMESPFPGELQSEAWSADTIALNNKLIKDAATLSDSEKNQFTANMQIFLHRACQPTLGGDVGKDGKLPMKMDESEVTGTLKKCDELLDPDAKGLYLDGLFGKDKGQHLRTMLAEQIMGEAAYPSNTDQGRFDTCNVTSIETHTWFNKPSVAASMVADEALTGKWTAADGHEVQLPKQDFQTDKYSKDLIPPDRQRSYAGQIFQATALSDMGSRVLDEPEYCVTDGIHTDEKGHEHGNAYWVNKDGVKIYEFAEGFSKCDPAKELKQLNGQNTELLVSSGDGCTGKKSESQYWAEADDNVVLFKDKDELREELKDAQKKGKMPVLIIVAASDQFFSDQNHPFDPKAPHNLNHCICIDQYNEKDGTLVINNSWGSYSRWGTDTVLGSPSKESKHPPASIDDFFPATQGNIL